MIIGVSGKIGSGKDTVGKIIQYLTVSDYENVKAILKERNGREITVEEHFNSFVERDYKVQWQIKKFAYKVKQIVSILTGIPVEDLEKQEVKDKVLGEEWKLPKDSSFKDIFVFNNIVYAPYTYRSLLQTVGTDAMRNMVHPNIWINALFADYKAKFKVTALKQPIGYTTELEYPNWIITDLRFPNELKAIKDRGGIVIRVNRKTINLKENNNLVHSAIQNGEINPNDLIEHPSETALDDAEFDYVIDNNGTIEDLIIKVKEILIKEELL